MKKIFLFLAISFSLLLQAQDLANKVPENTPFALCINSKNLNNKVAIKTIQEYPWMQNLLENQLKFLPKDLSQTGIDFTQKSYQYYSNRDTVMNYVILIPLSNPLQFEKIIQAKYGDSLKVKKQTNYSSVSTSKNHHLAWNDKFAVLVNATYTKPYKSPYNEPYSNLESLDSTKVFRGVSDVIEYHTKEPVTYIPEEVKTTPAPEKTKTSKKSKTKKGKKTKKTIEEPVVVEPTAEEIYATQEKEAAELDKKDKELQELENKQTDSIEELKIIPIVDQIFKETFDSTTTNSSVNSTIFKDNDPKSDFYAFADLDLLTSQLIGSFAGSNAALLGIYKNGLLNSNYNVNGYFEKDRIRLLQVITPKNEETKKAYQEMFNSKIDKNLLNYGGNNILGYYSISMDTQAVINYEYNVMKNTLNSVYKSYSKEAKANEADVLIDALALLLDEKAIADLVPGNAIFVLHNIKKVQREYISYDYDENYESTEKKETKEEIQPDFTFLLNTRNETFINKLLKLPLNKSSMTGTDYQLTNGYYTIHFEKDNLLENLYFGLKKGVLMITTSKENVENLIQQKTTPFPADFKKSISKNNASGWFDLQKIITASKTETKEEVKEETKDEVKEEIKSNYWDIALKNAGEISFESKFKNGTITSESSYTIKGEHTNSLQYFFDVINELYAEKQKK